MLIGELATATVVSTKTLRFYETDGLLPEPDRTPAGYRDYTDTVIDRVVFIRQAQAAGLTLAQIRQILTTRDGGQPPCDHVADLVDQRIGQLDRRLALPTVGNESPCTDVAWPVHHYWGCGIPGCFVSSPTRTTPERFCSLLHGERDAQDLDHDAGSHDAGQHVRHRCLG
jgi:DNA-binding transcriptional MerR regulator